LRNYCVKPKSRSACPSGRRQPSLRPAAARPSAHVSHAPDQTHRRSHRWIISYRLLNAFFLSASGRSRLVLGLFCYVRAIFSACFNSRRDQYDRSDFAHLFTVFCRRLNAEWKFCEKACIYSVSVRFSNGYKK